MKPFQFTEIIFILMLSLGVFTSGYFTGTRSVETLYKELEKRYNWTVNELSVCEGWVSRYRREHNR